MQYGIYDYLVLGYGPDEVEALEGYNWDTRQSIMKNPKVEEALQKLKEGKGAFKSGRKSERTKDFASAKKYFQEAMSKYTTAYKLADELKSEVNKMAEPDNLGQRILSHFTPLWAFKFPRSEVTDVSPTVTVRSDGSLGMGVTVTHTTYTDYMSKGTKSGVKRNFQERMNLFMKTLSQEIGNCKAAISRCSK